MPLWSWQAKEIAEHTNEPGWFLFADPRTGKTRVIVYEIAQWITNGARRILIVAPKTAGPVWLQDSELGMFDPAKVQLVNLFDDTVAERVKGVVLSELPQIIVVNRDVIANETLLKTLKKWNPDALVLDESHDFRNIGAKRTRAAILLAKNAKYKRGLTGTPDPNNYLNLYAQYRIVAPEVFGTRKADFVAKYCVMNYFFPNKVESYTNVEELQAKMRSRSTRVTQADVFDMPAVRDVILPVPFTKLARELYDELVENSVADFLGLPIDATHQLSKLTTLHQLCCGFVRNGTEVEWVFDGKIAAALDQIDLLVSAGKRVVLFHHYSPEGTRLTQECVKRYGAPMARSLHGGSTERPASPFLYWPELRVFVAQEDTANLAISLREADFVLWYSWGPKYDVHYQARQRIFDDRNAKPNGLTYTYLDVPNSADGFMRAIVSKKRAASTQLLDGGFMNAAYGRIVV